MAIEHDIRRAVEQTIDEGQAPGAVVLLGKEDDILYHEAFGHRMIEPERRPMQRDTIFDLASLTKPIATAVAVMQSVESGDILLRDPVSRYVPAFTGDGREHATIRHLMTHSAGIPAHRNYPQAWGEETPPGERRSRVVDDICALPREHATGEGFIYSCLGYILLASIIEGVAGRPLDQHVAERIFAPLAMPDTCFNPPDELLPRCAATEQLPDGPLVGVVHDENARYLRGVGGNAGLFSTAADLSRCMRALLNGGSLDGAQAVAPASAALLLSPQLDLPHVVRTLAWGVQGVSSPVAGGDLFPTGTVGHTGFTGTSIWADPASRVYVIILTNRVHLGRDKTVDGLRQKIANIAAAALLPRRPRFTHTSRKPVRTGLDVLAEKGFAHLEGKRIGLIANHTAIDSRRAHILDLMRAREGVHVAAILSPEHGFTGELDETVPSGTHADGTPIHSLYGDRQAPTPEMLEDLDMLVYDIADIGVRFYTYTATMALCMKAAAESSTEFIVLDRPNPINGVDIEGPKLDDAFGRLSAWHPIPLRHGMTSGELALLSNQQYELGCDLTVIECEGWRRGMWFDETGLPWVDPSPNMRNLKQAILYPCIGMLEAANISVGRGTDTPFELFGAPWIDGGRLARRLNALAIEALSFIPIRFTPTTREFAGECCEGVYIMLGDRARFGPVEAGLRIALLLRELWPETFAYEKLRHLIGTEAAIEGIAQMRPVEEIVGQWEEDVQRFRDARAAYSLYD